MEKSKLTTISVRVDEELIKKIDHVTEIIGVNKSAFVRACLEKLSNDNQMLLDHCDKADEYFNFIRNELLTLSSDLIMVQNGSWSDVSSFLIVMLCDYLMKVKVVGNNWKDFIKKYNLSRADTEKRLEKEDFEGLFGLESLVFLSAEKAGALAPEDVSSILNREYWINGVEADKISLIFAVKKSFEDQSARTIIRKYLEQEEETEKKPLRIIIDAKGKFRRSGDMLYLPVYTEALPTGEQIL